MRKLLIILIIFLTFLLVRQSIYGQIYQGKVVKPSQGRIPSTKQVIATFKTKPKAADLINITQKSSKIKLKYSIANTNSLVYEAVDGDVAGAINQLKVISQPETINNQLEVITSPANILIQQPTTTTLEETTTTTTTPPEQVTYKASDFNENGCVDEQDYITFQSYFSAKDSNADLDSDGEVAFADFLFFARENKEYGC